MAGMFPFRISPEAHEHFGNLAQRMGDWRLRDKELKEEKKRLEMTLQSQQDINKRTLYMGMQGQFQEAIYRAVLDGNPEAVEALCDMAVEKGIPPDAVRATIKRAEGMADRSRQTTPVPTPVPVEGAPVSEEGAPATPEDEESRQRRELTKRLGLPYVTSPEEGGGLGYFGRPPTEGIREQRRAKEAREWKAKEGEEATKWVAAAQKEEQMLSEYIFARTKISPTDFMNMHQEFLLEHGAEQGERKFQDWLNQQSSAVSGRPLTTKERGQIDRFMRQIDIYLGKAGLDPKYYTTGVKREKPEVLEDEETLYE